MLSQNKQSGIINPLVLSTVVLGVLSFGLAIFSVWSFVSYLDYRNNTDPKIDAAAADARQKQKEEDEAAFLEREKQPTRELKGPNELGSVTISYPKTWSVYLNRNGESDRYEAYLHPGVVHPINSKTPYATKIIVEPKDYEAVLREYSSLVNNGKLRVSPISIKGENGTRLDGTFNNGFRGSAVIFKVRGSTLRVITESDTFQSDFNGIVLASLTFSK